MRSYLSIQNLNKEKNHHISQARLALAAMLMTHRVHRGLEQRSSALPRRAGNNDGHTQAGYPLLWAPSSEKEFLLRGPGDRCARNLIVDSYKKQ